MGDAWIYPILIIGGALQACGASMNSQLKQSLANPYLASLVSFLPILCVFAVAFLMAPHPLPTTRSLAQMPWWAALGGVVGAVQVYAGLTLVRRVGAGPFMAFTVTASIVASLAIDHFGWFRMEHHPLNAWRACGGVLLVGGVALIARF